MAEQEPETGRPARRWRLNRLAAQLPLLATLATVVISGYNVLQSQRQYLDSEASTRFASAITLLANDNFNARLGGIFVLNGIARSSSENGFASAQVLAAYLRQQHAVTAQSRAAAYAPGDAAEDVQAALVGITGRLDVTRPLSLAGVSARHTNLSDSTLTNLNFRSADLSGLNAENSSLSGVQFTGSTLDQASFKGATLKSVDFSQASVKGTDFSGADLRGATHLTTAMLATAKVSGSTQTPTDSASDAGTSGTSP